MFSKNQHNFKLTRKSLRIRLTLFFVLALAILLASLSTVLIYSFEKDVQDEFDKLLYNYASNVAQNIRIDLFGDPKVYKNILFAKEQFLPFELKNSILQFVDQFGRIAKPSGQVSKFELPVSQYEIETFKTGIPRIRFIKINGKNFRAISFPVNKDNGKLKILLQIAVPLDWVEVKTEKNRKFYATVVPVALIIIFIAGFLFSSIALKPLNQIIMKTQGMTISDLSDRLPASDAGDELSILANTLNDLFDRLDKSFKSQDEFVANASHQLKTPLTIIKGQLDVFKTKQRTEEETQELIKKLSSELDHLIKIVRDLLVLASLDSQEGSLPKQEVQMDELVFESVSRIGPLAESRSVRVELNIREDSSSVFKAQADSNLIMTMLQALLENAVEHSPEGECVRVNFAVLDDIVEIKVHNKGDIISKDVQEKIFKRFIRSSEGGSGVGLGLAISQEIAQAHGGNISVSSSLEHGTEFSVVIKKV